MSGNSILDFEALQVNRNIKSRKYWEERLINVDVLSYFNNDIYKTDYGIESFSVQNKKFPEEVFDRLDQIASSDKAKHVLLISALSVLISKYSSSLENIIFTPVFDLSETLEQNNKVIPVRFKIQGDVSFSQFVHQVKNDLKNDYSNSNFPLTKMLGLSPEELDKRPKIGLCLNAIQNRVDVEDISPEILFVFETEKEPSLEIQFDSSKFSSVFIDTLAEHFFNLLDQLIHQKGITISEVNVLSEKEAQHFIYGLNNRTTPYPQEETVISLFRKQVSKHPENTAISINGSTISYKELDELSNRIASFLKNDLELAEKSLVGVVLELEKYLVPVILGILKAGCAYIPIDINTPKERIITIAKSSELDLVITRGNFLEDLKEVVNNIVDLNTYQTEIDKVQPTDLIDEIKSEDLAYIIYTSGSTGVPKGVMIPHKSLVNYIDWASKQYLNDGKGNFPLYTSISFDLTVTSIFTPLTTGNQISIYNENEKSIAIEKIIMDDNINVIKLTPSHLKILDHSTAIQPNFSIPPKRLIVGGEELTYELANSIYNKFNEHITIYNEYGPTEATVGCMIYEFKPEDQSISVPIGEGIQNTNIYVLDENLNVVPNNVDGEIYISGEGLALGYISQKELTDQRFIQHPFVEGKKMYKTGDIGVRDHNDRIIYKGRIDDQVKIRGYRVEIGEIEYWLSSYPEIKEAIVIHKKDAVAGDYLSAYYQSDFELEDNAIETFLISKVPDYMVPSYFCKLDHFPLTINGKIDKKALPNPQLKKKTQFVPPSNELEEKLQTIWGKILPIEKEEIGICHSFFDLGGHSLLATILVNQISKELKIAVGLKDIFEYPSIQELTKHIANEELTDYFEIQKAKKQKYYPLSSAQKRQFVLNELEKNSIAYNMPTIVRLEGQLNKENVATVFRSLVQRHEILRTVITVVDNIPMQQIKENMNFKPTYFHCSEAEVSQVVKGFIKPFDLSTGPLLRVGLIDLDPNNHILMIDMHHIICDGVSKNILFREFLELYNGGELLPNRLEYTDYVLWQQGEKQETQLENQKAFWLEKFATDAPVVEVPTDFDRNTEDDRVGGEMVIQFTEEETNELRKITEEQQVTMYMVLVSVYVLLLHKISNQSDVTIGTVSSGRQHADLEHMLGMFVNTIPVRFKINLQDNYTDFLQYVKSNILDCFNHQDFQYEDLIDELKLERNSNRNPLFDNIFAFENSRDQALKLENLDISPFSYEHNIARFDQTLMAIEEEDTITLSFGYAASLFKEETIQRFVQYYKRIVAEIVQNQEKQIKDFDILPDTEKKELLVTFNQSFETFSETKNILESFQEQVRKYPDNVAVVCNKEQLTYKQLDQKTNQLARFLVNNGVNKGALIPLCINRSLDMVMAILGILKTGGAYVPIDPNYPEDRVKHILKDIDATIVLVDSTFNLDLGIDQLNLEQLFENEIASFSQNPIAIETDLEDIAYVNYTSGSVGLPKGVLVKHSGVVRLLDLEGITFDTSTTTLQLSSIAFDAATFELWIPLLKGGTLVMYPQKYLDIELLNNIIKKNNVNTIWLTSGLLDQWCKSDISDLKLKYVVSGGDVVHPGSVKAVYDKLPNVVMYNGYGPTENTTFTCFYKIPNDLDLYTSIPIGKPIAGTKVYIVDGNLNLVPKGVVGELLTSGVGVSKGYINNPELTKQKFIKNFFDPKENNTLYRTGDLVRWLGDGNIEYIGRKDKQVKIRGYRIELDEIENNLSLYDGIIDVIVVAKGEAQGKTLVAYYTTEQEIDTAELRSYVSQKLPEYMVPSFFVELDRLPLTVNGKVDRNNLPMPEIRLEENHQEPSNALEAQLRGLWSDILGVKEEVLSVAKSFFELGGHSLKAAILVNRIAQELKVKISLKDIFVYQNIRQLAQYIAEKDTTTYIEIPRANKQDYYPQSSTQKRVYFMYEFDKESLAYNMPSVFELTGELDKKRLEEAFKKLIDRHEILRTSFMIKEGQPVQYINNNVDFKIEYHDHLNADVDEIVSNFIRPFDLGMAPLLRVGLITRDSSDHILMLDIHHIINDGVSQGILIRDFVNYYNGKDLEELQIQYKDYAVWQQSEEQKQNIESQKAFWKNEFVETPEVLELPIDYSRVSDKVNKGAGLNFLLNSEDSKKLREIAQKENVTTFMLFLSFYYILLNKLTNLEDVTIGTTVAGRQHADIENMLGMFVNTIPLRNYPNGSLQFVEFLAKVKTRTLQALDNQEIQYDDIVDELKLDRVAGHNPLFDVLFVFEQFEDNVLEIPNLSLSPYQSNHAASKLDLMLSVKEEGDQFFVYFEYSTKLFKTSTIERFSEYLQKIISSVVQNDGIKLSDIDILSEGEKLLLLNDFKSTPVINETGDSIISLFENQVKRDPDKIALIFEEEQISYRELNALANQVAKKIIQKQSKTKSKVALYFDPSIQMIASILGVIKANSVYVPLAPSAPAERNAYILKDCQADLVVVQEGLSADEYFNQLSLDKEQIICFDYTEKEDGEFPEIGMSIQKNKEDLLNVIYTSGTTGNPKGVEVKEKGVLNYICWRIQKFGYHPEDVTLQLFPYIFDAYATNFYTSLLSGATMVLVSEENRVNPKHIVDTIKKEKVTNCCTTPAIYNAILDELKSSENMEQLRFIGVGGERPTDKLLEKSKAILPHVSVNNEYGPTESSIAVTYNNGIKIGDGGIIGKPIPNTEIYILGKNMELLPIGVPGELFIGGVGLAKGYLNNPELTKDKFMDTELFNAGRLYRTGDMAKWLPDGNIEFIGRIDNQVKIRGFRIELGEIENQLLKHPDIEEVTVIVVEKNNDKHLIGYFVGTTELDRSALKTFLQNKLPEYMIPPFYVQLEEMPLTPNGKIDKKKLPDFEIEVGEDYVSPKNETQERLVRIWSVVLDLVQDVIGIKTNFFEIGGNSIKLMNMVNLINEEFEYEISVVNVFEFPTIEALSRIIDQNIGQTSAEDEQEDVSFEEINSTLDLFDIDDE
ncbi:non-ribosomal peptide synthetase [Aquimarina spongiae]|uniref:Tyrocidine synthetase-2 n=1 Tax=Aquimarina spongiae TaxID=570521 RepID=A0A1M6LJM2_9FLAO|nr:non-ribosomal peptide synthetase [Aquimarina spongiae]SHJ71338.1 tyrocidine synthetase-2 [Aquimarina spongiae]